MKLNYYESKFSAEFKDGASLTITECVTGFKVYQSLADSWHGTDGLYFDTMIEALDWVKVMSDNKFVLKYANGSLQVEPSGA